MPEPADRPPLRDQIAEALYRHTMDHAAGGPARLLTRDETVLWENSLARADAVLPVIEAALARARASCCEDGDRTYAEMERHLTRRAEEAERERDSLLNAMPALDMHVVLFDPDTDPCVDWCPKCLHERAEAAERKHAEALDQIATERRGRLAAEAAARRGRAAAEDLRRQVGPSHIVTPYVLRILHALTIKQPKETPR